MGHHYVMKFLNDAWNEDLGKYVNCTFKDFKKNRNFERLLLQEQRGLCCYCMRNLSLGKHTTLEHILPLNENEVDKQKLYFRECGVLRKNVRFYFITPENCSKKLRCPKYPHFCAYENLVLSCDGSIYKSEEEMPIPVGRLHNCCNNVRGNQYILPLFYKRHIQQYVEYDKNGTLMRTKQMPASFKLDFDEYIKVLRLNQDTLKLLRKTWCEVVRNGFSVADVMAANAGTEDEKNKRQGIVAVLMFNREESTKILKDQYWNLLCQYTYFYRYYKHKRINA